MTNSIVASAWRNKCEQRAKHIQSYSNNAQSQQGIFVAGNVKHDQYFALINILRLMCSNTRRILKNFNKNHTLFY